MKASDHYDKEYFKSQVETPLEIMRDAYRVVRPGGRVVLVVPCDAPSLRFRENDRDLHLLSWSANNIGNLLKIAGFNVAQCNEIHHRWPPFWPVIQKWFGWRAFHVASALWARADRRRSQVRAIAWKPIWHFMKLITVISHLAHWELVVSPDTSLGGTK